MTQDEILVELESKGIIVNIAGNYLMTEKYKELLQGKLPAPVAPKKTQFDDLLSRSAQMSHWPFAVLESAGRLKMIAFMNACSIPTRAEKGYFLRGVTSEAIDVLGNIIMDTTIDPDTMIEAITVYYKYVEMPKSFSKFLVEGLAHEVYQENLNGKFKSKMIGGDSNKDNQTWQ